MRLPLYLLSCLLLTLAAIPIQPPNVAQADGSKIRRIIWAYYVPDDPASWASLQSYIGELDYVSPHWLKIDAKGELQSRENETVLSYIKSKGVKVLPSLTLAGSNSAETAHHLLTEAPIRERAINNIKNRLLAQGYDGIHIDFEGFDAADRPFLTDFMARLATTLHPVGKLVTMAVPAKESDTTTGWAGPFDYRALAPSNDLILLMAYGFRTSKSKVPGSVAPLPWVERCLRFAATEIPPDKLLLGVPFYGYDWTTGSTAPAQVRRYPETMAIAREQGARVEYDQESRSAHYRYLQQGQEHEVWFEDAASLAARLDLVDKYGLAGAGGWRLGHEDPQVWTVMQGRLAHRLWYLAEGSTAPPFHTWVLIQNPNRTAANVNITFFREDGSRVERQYRLGPTSRFSLFANEVVPNAAISTLIKSDQPIFVERAMYFGHDGHASVGITSGSTRWYLPEGRAGQGYDTWILLFNPGGEPADTRVTFMGEDGSIVERTYQLKPHSRFNLLANWVLPAGNFSTLIESNQAIITERATYFAGGGHGSTGSPITANRWYFAEGYTGPGYETNILLMNPNKMAAEATLTWMKEDGTTVRRTIGLRPTSRTTVYVNTIVLNAAFSTEVESTQPIVAERSMYFARQQGGHSSLGTPLAAREWYLPEGCTAYPFSEFVLIMNPGQSSTEAKVTFMKSDGGVISREYTLAPTSRLTIPVGDIVPNAALSTQVQATGPVVVERAMYFSEGRGGTATLGIRP
ncbi:MAG: glycosyl hydrolase family 18 protein [Chloroflexi bacterium]|nr:glycosyl hydrolase family 18 protein [Chloroflexota bacterium]MCL5075050.1 glycosyl hydrolase family 18 protein [Chloroflexota bacterium]